MPKTQRKESVLHDWVMELPFQQQALLMTGVRGPDGSNKHNAAKCIVRFLRGVVLKPAGDWSGQNDNDFMWADYKVFDSFAATFWDDHDEYPHHFMMHLIHCAEVLGYRHPDAMIRAKWHVFYLEACDSFHMQPELAEQMNQRLNDFGCGIHN